jgi:hypothetical protein
MDLVVGVALAVIVVAALAAALCILADRGTS